MQFPAPLKYRFWCVYRDGLAEYSHNDLTACLRYIGRQITGRAALRVTMKQAMDAGFEIRSV